MKNPRLLYIIPALVLLVLAIVSLSRNDHSYLTAFQALLGLGLLILAFTKRRIL
jgi:hypothetical protein